LHKEPAASKDLYSIFRERYFVSGKEIGLAMKTGNSRLPILVGFVCGLLIVGVLIIMPLTPHLADITGLATSQVYVGFFYDSDCIISLDPGWNLISIGCQAHNMSPETVFMEIKGNYTSVHGYDATQSLDKWKVYNPILPSWVVNDLREIDTSKGYWIHTLTNGTLNISGSLKYPRYINLRQGWNLVGYPTNMTHPVNHSLSMVLADLISVHAYNATDTADPWKVFSTSSGSDDLLLLTPGFGYWIRMSSSNTWVIDET
jgi:hypothetical protein